MNQIRYPWPEPPAHGEAIEVAEGVLWFRQPLPMALDHVNIYALDDGDSWTVIDTGLHSRKSTAIWEDMLAGPLKGKPVSRVVLTHHHPDHVGNAGWLAARGADIWSSRTAWLLSRMLTLDEQVVPTAETLAFYRACGMRDDIYEARKSERPFNFADAVHAIPLGFKRLQQGDVVQMGGREWDVHAGGGHAPEHLTFWSRDDNLVLSGDQILPSISSNVGVYATEPEADPVSDWFESCNRLRGLARDEHLVLGGHKTPFVGLETRLTQLIDNHHGCLDRLREHLSEPKTAGECFMPLFKRQISSGEYGLALVEAMAHCLHLWHAGVAERDVLASGAWQFQMKLEG